MYIEDKEKIAEIRKEIGGYIPLFYRNGSLYAEVDIDAIKDRYGIDVHNHILNEDSSIRLFNHLSNINGVKALDKPQGYMKPQGNIHEYFVNKYEEVYGQAYEDIAGMVLDAPSSGVASVYMQRQKMALKNMKEALGKRINYTNLRHVVASEETKECIDTFVRSRLSMTIAYNMKRGYDKETLESLHKRCMENGKKMGQSVLRDAGIVSENSVGKSL